MKQFDLNEYLKNPSRRVVTRDGNPVRIICTDEKISYKVIGLIEENGKEVLYSYLQDGRFVNYKSSDNDLFFYTETKDGWVNLYRTDGGRIISGDIFEIKEEALGDSVKYGTDCKYIDTIKIQWEE